MSTTSAEAVSGVAPASVGAGARAGFLRQARSHRGVRAGVALASLVAVAVVAGPWVWTADPGDIDPAARFAGPSAAHPLGTDQLGRDVLARTLHGGRQSIAAAGIVLAGTFAVALTVGVTAAAIGGPVEALAMRAVDVVLAIPNIVLTLAILGVLGPGFTNLLLALVASSWAYSARLARSFVLDARSRSDVVAARLAGVGWARIIAGHLVPQAAAQLLVVATLDLGHTILVIAGLSFLGVGAEPGAAEWGAMLADARQQLQFAPWITLGPCLGIVVAVLSANLVGEGLAEVAS